MTVTDDVADVLEGLAAADAHERALTLRALQLGPVVDPRVAAALERLLDDASPVLVGQPATFGELRWLAAQALRAHRQALGIPEPVVVADVGPLLSAGELADLARAAGVRFDGDVESGAAAYAALAARGALPRRALVLDDAANQPRPSQRVHRERSAD